VADRYEELFEQLERNVERLQFDDVGVSERLDLCRDSRELVARCTQELQRLGTEIEELFLEDLLAEVNELTGDRPPRRRASSRRSARGTRAATSGATSRTTAPGGPPASDEASTAPAVHLLVERHLGLVAEALSAVGRPVTIAALVEHGKPSAFASLLAQSGTAHTRDAVRHVDVLLSKNRDLAQALRALARLAHDPDVARWFDHGVRDGHELVAELAREISPPAR
jgi:exonuclease VII small subunit